MNAASCIFPQIVVIVVLGFVCVNLRDLRETSGVSFEQYRLSKFGCVFSRRSRRGMQQAALSRRERQVV